MVHKKGVIIAAFNPSNDFKIAIACLGTYVRSDMLCSVLKKIYPEFEESAVWPRPAGQPAVIMIAIIISLLLAALGQTADSSNSEKY